MSSIDAGEVEGIQWQTIWNIKEHSLKRQNCNVVPVDGTGLSPLGLNFWIGELWVQRDILKNK